MENNNQLVECSVCNKFVLAPNHALHEIRCARMKKNSLKQRPINKKSQHFQETEEYIKREPPNSFLKQSSQLEEHFYQPRPIKRQRRQKTGVISKNLVHKRSQKNQQINEKISHLKMKKEIVQPNDFTQQKSSSRRKYKIFNENNIIQEKIPCSNCGYQQSLSELDTHPNQCDSKETKCQYCDQNFPTILMQQHHKVCSSRFNEEERQQGQNILQIQRYNQFEESNGLFSIFRNFLSRGNRRISPHRILVQRESDFNLNRFTEYNSLFQIILNLAQRGNIEQASGLNEQELANLQAIEYKNTTNQQAEKCTICYCDFEDKEHIIRLTCAHLYHSECINLWLKQNPLCPVCKRTNKVK